MGKYIKEQLQAQFKRKIEADSIRDFLVISTAGLNGVAENLMRGDLKTKGISILAVRNSLFCAALGQCGMESAAGLFNGQCAVAYGGDGVIEVAKEIVDWRKKAASIRLKGGFLEGMPLDAAKAEALAAMPSRIELQARIISMAKSPGARLLSALSGPWVYIAGCIKAVADRLEKQSE